jgi:hypothetical protein
LPAACRTIDAVCVSPARTRVHAAPCNETIQHINVIGASQQINASQYTYLKQRIKHFSVLIFRDTKFYFIKMVRRVSILFSRLALHQPKPLANQSKILTLIARTLCIIYKT